MNKKESSLKKIMALFVGLSLAGCGVGVPLVKKESNIMRLSVGMEPNEVFDAIGKSDNARSSKLHDGSVVRIEEIALYPSWSAPASLLMCWMIFPVFLPMGATTYLLFYRDGKLDKWGKQSDWDDSFKGEITIHNR